VRAFSFLAAASPHLGTRHVFPGESTCAVENSLNETRPSSSVIFGVQ
jgi:hypothetical protein